MPEPIERTGDAIPEESEYQVTVTAHLPGQQKASSYTFPVRASCNIEALAKGEDVWKRATEPRDVRVKIMEKSE